MDQSLEEIIKAKGSFRGRGGRGRSGSRGRRGGGFRGGRGSYGGGYGAPSKTFKRVGLNPPFLLFNAYDVVAVLRTPSDCLIHVAKSVTR